MSAKSARRNHAVALPPNQALGQFPDTQNSVEHAPKPPALLEAQDFVTSPNHCDFRQKNGPIFENVY